MFLLLYISASSNLLILKTSCRINLNICKEGNIYFDFLLFKSLGNFTLSFNYETSIKMVTYLILFLVVPFNDLRLTKPNLIGNGEAISSNLSENAKSRKALFTNY